MFWLCFGVYTALTFTTLIVVMVSNLFAIEVVLGLTINLFQLWIGVMATINLGRTNVKNKLPIYVSIWTILITYMVVQLLQTFNYMDVTYFHMKAISVFTIRMIAINFHEGTIFLATGLIIYHTYHLNKSTIALAKTFTDDTDSGQGLWMCSENPDKFEFCETGPKLLQAITVPDEVQHVRNAKNFRLGVERRLGIDWEHGEETVQPSNSSLQTN